MNYPPRLSLNIKPLIIVSILVLNTLSAYANHPNNGRRTETSANHFLEEFFGYESIFEAEIACDEYRAQHTDPVSACPNSVNAGWDVWPQPGPGEPLIFWFGVFNYEDCPEGTEIKAGEEGKGCQPKENDEGQCDADGTKTGKSINTATGNEYHQEFIDIGNGFDLSLSYNSHIRYNEYGKLDYNKLAPGWTMSYNMYITPVYTVNNQDYVVVHRGNGRYITYNKSGVQWLSTANDKDNILEKTASGWKFTSQTNQIETYGSNGKLETIEKNNQILSFTLTGSVISRISNANGNFIDFSSSYPNASVGSRYDNFTDNTGRQWIFTYSSASSGYNLESITYPDNTVKTFHYENGNYKNALTGITDQNGIRYVTYDYDTQGRIYHEQLAGGVEELTIVYNANNTRTLTNSRGKISTYSVARTNGFWQTTDITGPGCSNCSNANTSFVYDPATNDMLSKTVDGRITKYSNYGAKGQYGTKTEAFGTTEQRQTDYTYDARFFKKPLTITEPSVATGQNKVTTYTYDDHDNILSMSINGFTTDGTAVSATTTYQYNGPYNQISQIDGPRTDVTDTTTFEYYLDDPSEGDNRGRLKKMTNAAGIIMRNNIQYTPTGKILSEDKSNGLTTNYTYYAGNDRLETVSNTDGTKTITTHMDYLASGEIKQITRNYNTPDATTLTLIYDNARRLTKVTDQQGNYVQYTLDTEGNQTAEQTFDPNDILKKTISQVFDDYDQVDTSTQSGVTNNLDYGSDGNLYTQTNGNNIITDYNYDALNRLTQITQDLSAGTQATANTITAFEYDSQDRVSKVTDANNHNTLYQYDDLGRLTKLISPDTNTDTFSYDAAGNVISKTSIGDEIFKDSLEDTHIPAAALLTNFSYDTLNRPTAIDYQGNDLDVTFNYDQNPNGLNQLSSFTDSYSSTNLSYDAFGNLTQKSQTHNNIAAQNITLDLAYSYDANNRLSTITYPTGIVITYSYNTLNQITAISTSINGTPTNLLANAQYLPMGPLSSMTLGNGLNYTSSYDNGYRLTAYQYGSTLSGSYNYDNNHNITAITRESSNADKSYGYDSLDRITDETTDAISYSYDKLGNRITQTQNSNPAVIYQYDANSNKLQQIGNNPPRIHDPRGNTLNDEVGQYSYNPANRMDSYTQVNTLQAQYHYNGIGQRIHKYNVVNNQHHLYLYNANGQLLNETTTDNNGTQTQSKDTIWLGNKPIAQIRTINGTSTIYYILSDHLNTPRKVTDATGTVLWSWNSDAFGTTLANEDVDGNGTAFEFNLRFPGQYFDKESGIHYNYFRDYEAGTGRYLESDPIGQKGALNTYSYASNNSLYWTDSTGMINDNGRCTGLPVQFQQDCRNPPPPPSCKDGGYCSCEEKGNCCKKSFFSCMDDCVSFLNPWWSTSVGGAVGFGAAGAAGTTTTVACGWGGAAAGAWGFGTTAGCVIRCSTNPCYKY